jgi:hypothetical protein
MFVIAINLLGLLLLALLGWFCTHASPQEDDERSLRSGHLKGNGRPGPEEYATDGRDPQERGPDPAVAGGREGRIAGVGTNSPCMKRTE